ncbi:MAG: D-Ala-D-Ala carboxypeptidase family metallohydrolase [Cytophagales bacterium]|nr:D-Ala-D-Ala carboxypeptidase family metallohydrolase [Cytophagales bacterium]
MMRTQLTLMILLVCSSWVWSYSTEKAGFTIEVNGELNPYKVFSVFVMPGASFSVTSDVTLDCVSDRLLTQPTDQGWQVTAPEKSGAYSLRLAFGTLTMKLNVLVLTPLTQMKGEYLNGYRLGNYPAKALRGNPIYHKPDGLFEVTMENQDLQLTPHFTLKQFLCKQVGAFPKYLIVRERLLLKLEYLLEKVNEHDISSETFGFISGYRTPFYNASIKNVQYSRHVYGGAADIYIDQDRDGRMDDLNRDGIINEKDVRVFHQIVEGEFGKPTYDKYKGGLGFYRKNGRHHGFIHVDVRGTRARW